ncbi:tetratricopeptide repeat protein [Mariprofundus ferrooxydans]|nr:tetratricopeptide repeat protein [Mariprofundus ferrooxydans]
MAVVKLAGRRIVAVTLLAVKNKHTRHQQRLAFQPLAVVCLCALALSACASNEQNKVVWQQDKPQINASIAAVQHEQQISADALLQQATSIESLQQKLETLEQLNQQQLASIESLSNHVEQLHRATNKKTNNVKQKTKKPLATVKAEIKHPVPIAKAPPPAPVAAVPVTPKVDLAALAEAEKNAYTAAYLALKSGRFDEASIAFNKQLDLYPKGEYTDQAWYWLGETRLAQGDNNKALNAFKYVADHYANSVKHAAALLKLGQLSQSQNHYSAAQAYYQRLIQDHTDSSLAEQARAALSNLPANSNNALENQQ